jgi:hypothetical protein
MNGARIPFDRLAEDMASTLMRSHPRGMRFTSEAAVKLKMGELW